MKRFLSIFLAAVMVIGLLPVFSAVGSYAATELREVKGTITMGDGRDVTEKLTDNSTHTYNPQMTWYVELDELKEYVWQIQDGKLVIGGGGTVKTDSNTADSFPWAKLSDEITEIVVFPNSVKTIEGAAFASLKNVKRITIGEGVTSVSGTGAFDNGANGLEISLPSTLETVGAGLVASCTNVKVSLNNITKDAFLSRNIGENNEALLNASYTENTVGKLTVEPSGNGFANINNVTNLQAIVKTAGGEPLTNAGDYTWRLLITDGERIRENGACFSYATKLMDVSPDSAEEATGLYRFEVCTAAGGNQFVPQYDSAYIITVELYQNGQLAYTGSSAINKFKCDIEPIYLNRTSIPVYANTDNYLEEDFGEPVAVSKLKVFAWDSGSRYTQWQAYGSNDNTLPISKWTLLTEKNDKTSNVDDVANNRLYDIEPNADGGYEEYRYIRVYGSFDSERWAVYFLELHAYQEIYTYNSYKEVVGTITAGDTGTDVTDILTDNNTGTSYYELHWYVEETSGLEKYIWQIQDGKLIIGGGRTVKTSTNTAESFPWARFSDEITEVVVTPNSVSAIEGAAFASLKNVKRITIGEGVTSVSGTGAFDNGANGLEISLPSTLKTVGAGLVASCTNVKVSLNNLTKDAFLSRNIGANNEVLENAVYTENTVGKLTVTPSGNGFANENGVTNMKAILKTSDGKPLANAGDYTWRLLVTDGERIRENGACYSYAMKLMDVSPDSADESTGLYKFEVCNAEGKNQFVPQYDSAYVLTVELYGQDGQLAYTGTSKINAFKCDIQPIYEKRTAFPVYANTDNYFEEDFGRAVPVAKLQVNIYPSGSRYTQWQAYGSNDNTLPLCKWTLLAEKNDTVSNSDEISSERKYDVATKSDGSFEKYRYIRIYGSFDSQRWSIILNELHVFIPQVNYDITWSINGVDTTVPTGEGEIPTHDVPVIPSESDDLGYTKFHVFVGWTDGKNFYRAGAALPEVTAAATYTAVFETVTLYRYDKGDVNKDQLIDITDVTCTLNYLAGVASEGDFDFNEDGITNIRDVTWLLNTISALPASQEGTGKYITLVVPKNTGDYFDVCVNDLAEYTLSKTGTALLTESDAASAGLVSAGYTFCIGVTDSTPIEMYNDLGVSDYRIAKDGNVYYIVGGSDIALGAAVKKAKELFGMENAELPIVYKATETEAVTVRVGSYNIQNGNWVNHDFKVLAQDILDQKLDIVGLQEVDMFTTRNKNQDTLKALSEATGYPYYKYCKCIDLQGGEYGTAILSRYPIVSYQSVKLYSGSSEQRGYGHAVIDIDGVQVDFINTHLAWPDKTVRAKQFIEISTEFAKYGRCILTGDLNAPDKSEYLHLFPGCDFANGVNKIYITNEEDGPIDNIITTSSTIVQLQTGMVGNVAHSDHYMLWADLAIMANSGFKTEEEGVRFYENGSYLTGWQVIGGNLMYFAPETGYMASGTVEIDGKNYTFIPASAYGTVIYRLAEGEEPIKEAAPQLWINWLVNTDNGATYNRLQNGSPFLVKYDADGKNHRPCAFTYAMGRALLGYQFDGSELSCSSLKKCTFDIYYKEAGSNEGYSVYQTTPFRVSELEESNGVLCMLNIDLSQTTALRTLSGKAKDFEVIFVIRENDTLVGWRQDVITVTDSYELFLADALK